MGLGAVGNSILDRFISAGFCWLDVGLIPPISSLSIDFLHRLFCSRFLVILVASDRVFVSWDVMSLFLNWTDYLLWHGKDFCVYAHHLGHFCPGGCLF